MHSIVLESHCPSDHSVPYTLTELILCAPFSLTEQGFILKTEPADKCHKSRNFLGTFQIENVCICFVADEYCSLNDPNGS